MINVYHVGGPLKISACILMDKRLSLIHISKMRPKVAAAVQMVVAPFMFRSSSCLLYTSYSLVNSGNLKLDIAAKELGISIHEFEIAMKEAGMNQPVSK